MFYVVYFLSKLVALGLSCAPTTLIGCNVDTLVLFLHFDLTAHLVQLRNNDSYAAQVYSNDTVSIGIHAGKILEGQFTA